MIEIIELAKLKEQRMTDSEIAEELTKQGIKISVTSVNVRLRKYYEAQGIQKPRGKTTRRISDEELARLKEEGMTDYEIAEEFTEQGRRISRPSVNLRLIKYYGTRGIRKPRGKTTRRISDEELVRLKEGGMSDSEIAEELIKKGIKISRKIVNEKLRKYYETRNIQKSRAKRKTGISTEQLVDLKEQGMSDGQIAKHFSKQGIEIKSNTVAQRLYRYYKAQGKEKPKIKRKPRVLEEENKKEYDNPIKQMLMSGMTVYEFFSDEGEQLEDAKKTLEKLKIIALCSEKANGEWISDYDFATVIRYAKGIMEISELESHVKPWLREIRKMGCTTFIKESICGKNADLTTYILSRFNLPNYKNDDTEFKVFREQYEEKIDKYLERLRIVEEGRRKNKGKSEITNIDTISGDER